MKNFTKMFLAACMLIGFAFSVNAQSVGINSTGAAPNSSAMLDVSSTTTGFLPPRMTYVQKSAIASPAAGLIVWCSNCGTFGELQVFNGTSWTNSIGGTASGLPGAPAIGTATAGIGEASVTFSAPGSDGGSVITLYTATSSPGNITGTLAQAGSGTITVTGLTPGTTYTFTVTATSATGTGAASAASNSVTLAATAPGAPTIGTAIAGIAQVLVPFTAPSSNGGSTILSYTATSSPGNITGTLTQAGSGTITVTGLTGGTAYTFTVTATNAIGTSAASAASNSITPTSTVPGAPTIGTATAGIWQALVPFTAPASNGGSAITSYTATSNPGNKTGTLTQAGSGTITVTGLTAGTAYTFTVTATNATGTGAASAASNSVTPVGAVIGDSYGGGILAYILKDGDPGYVSTETHGLIAATTDQSAGIVWAIPAFQYTFMGTTSVAIGQGLSNTDKIIALNGAGTSYAAGLARSYAGGGYSDWFLPSSYELNKLYDMRVLGFGGFTDNIYWSSSEVSAPNAFCRQFNIGGSTLSEHKTIGYYVRAIRAF